MEAKMLDGKVAMITGASYGMGAVYGGTVCRRRRQCCAHCQRKRKTGSGSRRNTSTKGALNTLTKNVAMRLVDTNIRCNAVAPGATVTPAHLANRAGEQPGGAKMLEYSGHYVYFPGPECDPMDQAYACLYLASKMGKAVRGQVLQVCNGAFL